MCAVPADHIVFMSSLKTTVFPITYVDLCCVLWQDPTQIIKKKKKKITSRPPLDHTTLKALQTVVILDNAQSLVNLTPLTTEHTDHFQTNPSWSRLAAVWHKGRKTKRNIWDLIKTAKAMRCLQGSELRRCAVYSPTKTVKFILLIKVAQLHMINCSSLLGCHDVIQFFPMCHSNQTTWRLLILQNSDLLKDNKSWPLPRQRQREWETGILAIWQGMNLNPTCGCHKQQELLREASVEREETFHSRKASGWPQIVGCYRVISWGQRS